MSISIGSEYLYSAALTNTDTSTTASKLEQTLGGVQNATDEELLDACKDFEAYLMEQMIESMKKTTKMDDEEEENEYIKQFGDMQYQEYAKSIAESGQLGIAQKLYDSIKNNS